MIPELSNLEAEDYWVRIVRIGGTDDDLLFDLHVTSNLEDEDIDCSYKLSASGVLNYCLSPNQNGDLFELGRNHPLIREYCEPINDLFCQVQDTNSYAALSVLLNAHREYAGDYLDPFDYINTCIVKGWSHGKIASGPESLIDAYKKSLQGIATTCNVLEVGPQQDWDGSAFHERSQDVVGFCFGSSYVLCKEYSLSSKNG